jgi:hypothetical protein
MRRTPMTVRTRTITSVHAAYEPPTERVRRRWQLVVAGLLLVALVAILMRPDCRIDAPGVNESRLGVRHEKRGDTWVHCEPWIRRRVLG